MIIEIDEQGEKRGYLPLSANVICNKEGCSRVQFKGQAFKLDSEDKPVERIGDSVKFWLDQSIIESNKGFIKELFGAGLSLHLTPPIIVEAS